MTASSETGQVWCVVPAAGVGRRFGGELPKQFVELDGQSLLMHTLQALVSHPAVRGVMVALGPDAPELPMVLHGKPILRCTGGATRAASVLAGLRALPPEAGQNDLVLVHDAARPNLRHADIHAVLEFAASSPSGALLALPVSDTLKQAGEHGEVECTVPRERFWRALTPQCFTRGALTDALDAAAQAGIDVTDESMAMERAGYKPRLVAGRADNLKITTPPDLAWFEAQLALRKHEP